MEAIAHFAIHLYVKTASINILSLVAKAKRSFANIAARMVFILLANLNLNGGKK